MSALSKPAKAENQPGDYDGCQATAGVQLSHGRSENHSREHETWYWVVCLHNHTFTACMQDTIIQRTTPKWDCATIWAMLSRRKSLVNFRQMCDCAALRLCNPTRNMRHLKQARHTSFLEAPRIVDLLSFNNIPTSEEASHLRSATDRVPHNCHQVTSNTMMSDEISVVLLRIVTVTNGPGQRV